MIVGPHACPSRPLSASPDWKVVRTRDEEFGTLRQSKYVFCTCGAPCWVCGKCELLGVYPYRHLMCWCEGIKCHHIRRKTLIKPPHVPGPPKLRKQQVAEGFLKLILAEGPQHLSDIQLVAHTKGICSKTLYKAAHSLHIQRTPAAHRQVTWSLK